MRSEIRKVEKEEVAGKHEGTYIVDTLGTPPMHSTILDLFWIVSALKPLP